MEGYRKDKMKPTTRKEAKRLPGFEMHLKSCRIKAIFDGIYATIIITVIRNFLSMNKL
jgi:hypothetical protein